MARHTEAPETAAGAEPREHEWTDDRGLHWRAHEDGVDTRTRPASPWMEFDSTTSISVEILRLAAREEELVARVAELEEWMRELEEWIEERGHAPECTMLAERTRAERQILGEARCDCVLAVLRRKP